MKKKVKIKDIALYSKGTQINGDELLEEAKAVIEKSLKELETLQASLMQKYFS